MTYSYKYFTYISNLDKLTYQEKDTLAYKTIINIQIKPTISVIAIAIHFVKPIQRNQTRYDWFSIWKSYLPLLLFVIIVEICAKAPYRINR